MEWLETEDCLDRHTTVLRARVRRSSGTNNDVNVLDISLAGCLIERQALSLAVDERVLLRLADLSFMPATVVWVEEDEVGVIFETELYEPVLERLKQCFVRRR